MVAALDIAYCTRLEVFDSTLTRFTASSLDWSVWKEEQGISTVSREVWVL